MSQPFIAEIRIFAGNFAPRSWAFCDGQLLPIAQNTALFSLIGTTYGGDGRTTTGLPNMKRRAPMHPGSGPGLSTRRLGQKGGEEGVSLTEVQMGMHSHAMRADSRRGTDDVPTGRLLANSRDIGNVYGSGGSIVQMSSDAALGNTGAGQPHNNMQPFLDLNFIIALTGLFPSRS